MQALGEADGVEDVGARRQHAAHDQRGLEALVHRQTVLLDHNLRDLRRAHKSADRFVVPTRILTTLLEAAACERDRLPSLAGVTGASAADVISRDGVPA